MKRKPSLMNHNRYLMKLAKFVLIGCFVSFLSCKKDDDRSCTTCQSDQTASFELCRESNGNASVNGSNTGTDYDVYLANLRDVGTTCGGI